MEKDIDDPVVSSKFNNRRDFIMGGVALGAASLMIPITTRSGSRRCIIKPYEFGLGTNLYDAWQL